MRRIVLCVLVLELAGCEREETRYPTPAEGRPQRKPSPAGYRTDQAADADRLKRLQLADGWQKSAQQGEGLIVAAPWVRVNAAGRDFTVIHVHAPECRDRPSYLDDWWRFSDDWDGFLRKYGVRAVECIDDGVVHDRRVVK